MPSATWSPAEHTCEHGPGAPVSAWGLTRVGPVSTQMAGPSAAALIRSGGRDRVRGQGVCATTVSREPVIHSRPAESMIRSGADMALGE